MSTRDDDEYEVGYGKPPKASRFKKGRSGNPKGRPKGAKGIGASLKRELESKVTVREGGRVVTISKSDVLTKRVVEKAMKGDMPAIKMVYRCDQELEAETAAQFAASEAAVTLDQTDEEVLALYAAHLQGTTPPVETETEAETEADAPKPDPAVLGIRKRRRPNDLS